MSVGARRYHMNIHTGEEHICDVCEKKFTCKASLDAHKFTHTGLHPYACRYCPKHFNSISGVRGHERQVHLGTKRKHKTKAQKMMEKTLIVQKKAEVKRKLTKKELKVISDMAKAATASEEGGPLKPGRKPRNVVTQRQPKTDNLVLVERDALVGIKSSQDHPHHHPHHPGNEYSKRLSALAPPPPPPLGEAVGNHAASEMSKKHFNNKLPLPQQSMLLHPDIAEYPTRVVIGEQDGQSTDPNNVVTHPHPHPHPHHHHQQAMPVDYSATAAYVPPALQKAIGLIPRMHGNAMLPPHPHAAPPWPSGQHISNSHLDTMVESLVQFSKNY